MDYSEFTGHPNSEQWWAMNAERAAQPESGADHLLSSVGQYSLSHRDYAHTHIVRHQKPAPYAARQQLPHPTRLPPPQPATHPPHPHEAVPTKESPQLKRAVSSYVWPDNKLPTDETSLLFGYIDPSERLSAIKKTIAKSVIAVELSRTWTETIVLVRPLAFGQPIEVEHVLGCHEAVMILLLVFTCASWLLYFLSKYAKGWALAGLIQTSAFMWSGATFSPTAMTCLSYFTLHPLSATIGYTCFGAAASIAALWAQGICKERGMEVVAQSLALVSIFIVISCAAVCNKEAGVLLPWQHREFMELYLRGEADFSPPVVALFWALVVNGVLVRVVGWFTEVVGQEWRQSKFGGAVILFFVKFFAFFTGFQFLAFVKLMWQVLMGSLGKPSVAILVGRAVTVFTFATCYIIFGSPISGVPKLSQQIRELPPGGRILREAVDKAFHDTAVGQSIGVTMTPLFKRLFTEACLLGGAIENALYPPEHEAAAQAAAYKQDWEVAAAVVYVCFVTTPMAVWLYNTVVVEPAPLDEKKAKADEKNNAAAAADDGGGDDGGDDGGGD